MYRDYCGNHVPPNCFYVISDKIKRLEGLLTKCKESIKANKQKTSALTEVKENLAKQVTDKESELEDLRSQFYATQTTLTSAQKEIDGYRRREQQEELQIAEVKMIMHQVCAKVTPFCFH